MKKEYKMPSTTVMRVEMRLLTTGGSDSPSKIKNVGGNANLNYRGGSTNEARSRGGSDWDDE